MSDLFTRALEQLRAAHRATVYGHAHGMVWDWSCSCGKNGRPTSEGRASAGMDRHLDSERRRIVGQLQGSEPTPDYHRDYLRGWRAGARATTATLDRADARSETKAWFDGYHDYAAGRPQWHSFYNREERAT